MMTTLKRVDETKVSKFLLKFFNIIMPIIVIGDFEYLSLLIPCTLFYVWIYKHRIDHTLFLSTFWMCLGGLTFNIVNLIPQLIFYLEPFAPSSLLTILSFITFLLLTGSGVFYTTKYFGSNIHRSLFSLILLCFAIIGVGLLVPNEISIACNREAASMQFTCLWSELSLFQSILVSTFVLLIPILYSLHIWNDKKIMRYVLFFALMPMWIKLFIDPHQFLFRWQHLFDFQSIIFLNKILGVASLWFIPFTFFYQDRQNIKWILPIAGLFPTFCVVLVLFFTPVEISAYWLIISSVFFVIGYILDYHSHCLRQWL